MKNPIKANWKDASQVNPPAKGTYLVTMDGAICGQEEPFTSICGYYKNRWDETGCVLAWDFLPEPYEGSMKRQ